MKIFREEHRTARAKGQDTALGAPYPQAINDYIARYDSGEDRYQCEVIIAESGDVVGYIRALHRLTLKNESEDLTKPRARQTSLHKLGILKDFQGLGLGKTLVERVIQRAKDKERDAIRINLPEGNPMSFYKKLGFKKVAQIPAKGNKRALDIIDLKLN